MEANNSVTRLGFSGRFIDADFVQRPKDFLVEGRTIVLNPNRAPVYIGESPRKPIQSFSSTILIDAVIDSGESVLLLRVVDEVGIRDIIQEPAWGLFGDLSPNADDPTGGSLFPKDTPLWRGPQEIIGTMEFDLSSVLDEASSHHVKRTFEVKANLWFAPAGTDCVIHNQHDFIEIHSQLYGMGRMQKFRERDHATLYEELVMSPGYTTPVPFCAAGPDGGFVYPWHQYHADSDCIWLAVGYHALSNHTPSR